MSSPSKPFDILSQIARQSVAMASGLPQQDQAVELWNGIGFTIGNTHFVAAMGTVSELLHLPKYTAVPGVKSWMQGIANVRGRLLPIMDLGRFFELAYSASKHREKRVLVVEHGEALSGIIVDGVMGMQYFSSDSFTKKVKGKLAASIKPYIKGAYMKGDIEWVVFDTVALTSDDKFLDVALS